MKSPFDLKGEVVLVTGGAGGIGRYAAKTFVSAGATVVIADRNHEGGKKEAGLISAEGSGNCIAMPVDIQDSNSVRSLVSLVLEKFSRIDVLVNSAGVSIRHPALEFPESDWDYILNINLKGTFLVCQAVGREMVKKRKGKIINISSVAALIAVNNRAAYCASKGGVTMLTKVLALEWAPYGVNVNAIGPGFTRTPLLDEFFDKIPGYEEKFKKVIPLDRIAETSDLEGVLLLLGSKGADYITGQTIYVDGGYSIKTGQIIHMDGGYTIP